MIVSVHQPQYLPWLGFFDKVAKSDRFVFLDTVQYKSREFQNRNKIGTKNGWIWLTVPVITKGMGRQAIWEVKIDNSVDWRKKHWESIKRAYAKADYFTEYADYFEKTYSLAWDKLSSLNVEITRHILGKLDVKTKLYLESELGTVLKKTDRIIEICKKLKADTYLSGAGGKVYLEEDKFKEAGIKLVYQEYRHPVYRQQYSKGREDFAPYMFILDLLFNEGDKSAEIAFSR